MAREQDEFAEAVMRRINEFRQKCPGAAETVRSGDFRALRHLANTPGDRFRPGIVLYAGEQQLSWHRSAVDSVAIHV